MKGRKVMKENAEENMHVDTIMDTATEDVMIDNKVKKRKTEMVCS